MRATVSPRLVLQRLAHPDDRWDANKLKPGRSGPKTTCSSRASPATPARKAPRPRAASRGTSSASSLTRLLIASPGGRYPDLAERGQWAAARRCIGGTLVRLSDAVERPDARSAWCSGLAQNGGNIQRMRGRWRRWVEDDFVDADAQRGSVSEPDPWEFAERPTQIGPASAEQPYGLREPTLDVIDEGGLSVSYDLDDEFQAGDPTEVEWSGGTTEGASDWDEPEPLVDAASDLSDSLYPPDETITNLSLELKVRELLSQVEPITEEQCARCLELLKARGIRSLRRMRRMLPWLRDRAWRGPQLIQFLELKKHWESTANIRWWETFLWSDNERRWVPRYQVGTLTLDHARALVLVRSCATALDVIDHRWFREWEAFAAWELGVRSFADFALFRASVPAEDDWLDHLARQDQRDALEIEQCTDPTFAAFMLPSMIEQYGLPRTPFAEPDPWPRASEFAREMAARSGGDRTRAWYDTLRGQADV